MQLIQIFSEIFFVFPFYTIKNEISFSKKEEIIQKN